MAEFFWGKGPPTHGSETATKNSSRRVQTGPDCVLQLLTTSARGRGRVRGFAGAASNIQVVSGQVFLAEFSLIKIGIEGRARGRAGSAAESPGTRKRAEWNFKGRTRSGIGNGESPFSSIKQFFHLRFWTTLEEGQKADSQPCR